VSRSGSFARQEALTQSQDLSGGPEGRYQKGTSAAFIAMDGMYAGFAGAKTGANLTKDNQPWPSACALHLGFGFLRRSTSCIPAVVHPSGRAESICHYSKVPKLHIFQYQW
jgi:hypothetical protein